MDTSSGAKFARLLDGAGSERLLEALPTGVSLLDAETRRIVYRNAEGRRILSRADMPHDGTDTAARLGFQSPAGRTLIPSEIPGVASLERGETVREQVIRMPCLDGSSLMLSVDSSPVRDESGEVLGAVLTYREVTPRHEGPAAPEPGLAVLERQQRFLTLLGEAVRDLSDAAAIAEITTRLVGVHLKVNRCAYGSVDVDTDTVRIFRGFVDGVPSNAGTYRLSEFGEAIAANQKSGSVDIVNDTATDPATREAYERTYAPMGTRAFIGVPLVKDGRFAAFFTVHQNQPREWTAGEVALVEEVAERTWSTIERINSMRALEESEARYRALVEGLPQLTWSCLPGGQCDYLSPQWLAFTGQTLGEGLGSGWLEAIHPEDRAAMRRAWERSLASGSRLEVETRLRRGDGTYRYFRTRAVPAYDAEGVLVKWMGTSSDIHDLLEAQTALAITAQRQREVADAAYRITHERSVREMLQTLTREARHILDARAALVRLDGDGTGHAIWAASIDDGRSVLTQIRATQNLDELVERVSRSYEARTIELTSPGVRAKLERLGLEEVTEGAAEDALIAPLLKHDGVPLGVAIGCIRPDVVDASEKASMLVQLAQVAAAAIENARQTESLEARVAERTALLQQKVSELESFTYIVSHDLRAPLRAIVGFSRLVLEDEGERVSPESRAMLSRLDKAAVTMSELIDDLLEYSRLGAKEPALRAVDFAQLSKEVAGAVQRDCPSAEIRVDLPDGQMVECDPRLMAILLRNLLDNSCKYVAPGEPPRIEVGRIGDAFFVRDHGIGLDMTYADKLFQPFSRLHASKGYAGTGIGLANVRRILERHHGRIWVESAVGEGTTFYFNWSKGQIS